MRHMFEKTSAKENIFLSTVTMFPFKACSFEGNNADVKYEFKRVILKYTRSKMYNEEIFLRR